MMFCGVLVELLDVEGAVADNRRAATYHLFGEGGQGFEQSGVLFGVAQDSAFARQGVLIIGEGGGVAGANLAEGGVEEAAAFGGGVADDAQILRAEQDGVEHAAQVGGRPRRDAVHGHFPPPVAAEADFHVEKAVSCADFRGNLRVVVAEPYHVAVGADAGRLRP